MALRIGNQIDIGPNIVGQKDPTIILLMPTFGPISFSFPATGNNGEIVLIITQSAEYGGVYPANLDIGNIVFGGIGDAYSLRTYHVYIFTFNNGRWKVDARNLEAGTGYGPVFIPFA